MRTCVIVACCVCAALTAAAAAPSEPAARSGLIVYWSDSPHPSIWSIRPDGTHRRRILRTRLNAKRPRLSPDRRWIAFDGAAPGKPPLSDFDVQVIRPKGTGRRTLTNSEQWDIDAQWSPDGTAVIFDRLPPHPMDETGSVIWSIRADGTGLFRFGPGASARWSPDGRQLVYEATGDDRGDLFVADLDGGRRRRLLATPELERPAAWSRDGATILFNRSGASGGSTMFRIGVDGTGLRRLGAGTAAGWSPDGSQILYTKGLGSSLYVMRNDGSRKHKLIAAVRASEPDWR